ncbi:hypothetical protein H9Q69_014147 [Fusarium xylarioides]|nr:hypothetical protein H9Q69_014147 [Fusarium xylarioides]
MNEHTKASLSKCKECKKRILVCQARQHAEGGGWRICDVPCGCGPRYYPSTAKEAQPLETTEYVSSHPQYESPPPDDEDTSYEAPISHYAPDASATPAEGPTFVELIKNGDYLQFYNHRGEVISTFREHWQQKSIPHEGVNVLAWQVDYDGYSYLTWTLDVGDSQEQQSERSRGKRAANASQSASHGRTLSAESIDPLQWDQSRIDEETVTSGMAGLSVQGESSHQAKRTHVSARLGGKDTVVFKNDGKKVTSLRESWVEVEGGFIFESKKYGCTFFAKEIKRAKK